MANPNYNQEMSANRHRLPTLNEVLQRRTAAPVDLFSFYIFMRDQKRAVDYLDFWLDVLQHMSLCRHYVRELRRSVLLDTPETEKLGTSKRSSQILDQLGQLDGSQHPGDEKSKDQHISAFLRSEAQNGSHHTTNSNPTPPRHSSEATSRSDRLNTGPGGTPHNGLSNGKATDSSSPEHTVARADLRASAEKILYTYLLNGAEREIILPQNILNDIVIAIEDDHRDDPEVFDAAKDYVFQAMERDAFPDFLRSKALGNLVAPSMFFRLVIGLLAIFGGLWAGFACIFLDVPRLTRCWLILPFSIGVYFLASQQYALDPILALLGFSEYTFMNWAKINDPYVRSLLIKRASVNLAITILIAAAVIVLFVFVPGKRL